MSGNPSPRQHHFKFYSSMYLSPGHSTFPLLLLMSLVPALGAWHVHLFTSGIMGAAVVSSTCLHTATVQSGIPAALGVATPASWIGREDHFGFHTTLTVSPQLHSSMLTWRLTALINATLSFYVQCVCAPLASVLQSHYVHVHQDAHWPLALSQ